MRRSPLTLAHLLCLWLGCALVSGPGPAAFAGELQQEPSGASAAQEPEAEAAEKTGEEAATISVVALKAAESVEQSASPELRKWVEDYVKANLSGETLELQDTFDAVPVLFRGQPPVVHDAVTFLILYRAFRREEERHQRHASAVATIDRELKKVEDQLRFWATNFRYPPEGTQARRDRDAQLHPLMVARESHLRGRKSAETVRVNARLRADFYLGFINRAVQSSEAFPSGLLAGVTPPKQDTQR